MSKDNFRALVPRITAANMQIIHEQIAPGADSGKAMLSHESEEAGW